MAMVASHHENSFFGKPNETLSALGAMRNGTDLLDGRPDALHVIVVL